MIKFTKMHGTGNDYIYINALKKTINKPENLALKMCNRHYGIGADGLILIMQSKDADFKMRIFNQDGSEAEMCGNGIRCFAKYVYDNKLIDKKKINIDTHAGIKKIKLIVKNNKVNSAVVDMGEPILLRERIPMLGKPGMVINETIKLDDGTKFEINAVSMGNPHAGIFVEDIENFPVKKYGPVIENSSLFPQKINVEFVQVINENEVIQRTWERGSGETMSCGTGGSAVTVAAILTKRTSRKLLVHLRGGDLGTEWNEADNHVYLSGPATEVFEGKWPD